MAAVIIPARENTQSGQRLRRRSKTRKITRKGQSAELPFSFFNRRRVGGRAWQSNLGKDRQNLASRARKWRKASSYDKTSHAHSIGCCRALDRRNRAPVHRSKGFAAPKQQG